MLNEIITGDSIFCATGITNGDIVSGIKIEENNYISETLITHKSTNLKKIIKSNRNAEKIPAEEGHRTRRERKR